MAGWTTAVAASMIDVNVAVAVRAMPEVAATSRCAATDDIGERTPMRWQNRRAMTCEIVVAEAAEDLRNFQAHASALTEIAHETAEQLLQLVAQRLGQVKVGLSGFAAGVTKKNLDHFHRHVVFE
jgi:hypothetical protein